MVALLSVTAATAVAKPSYSAATFRAHGSVAQVYVTGATGGERLTLIGRHGAEVATVRADSLGGAVFR